MQSWDRKTWKSIRIDSRNRFKKRKLGKLEGTKKILNYSNCQYPDSYGFFPELIPENEFIFRIGYSVVEIPLLWSLRFKSFNSFYFSVKSTHFNQIFDPSDSRGLVQTFEFWIFPSTDYNHDNYQLLIWDSRASSADKNFVV